MSSDSDAGGDAVDLTGHGAVTDAGPSDCQRGVPERSHRGGLLASTDPRQCRAGDGRIGGVAIGDGDDDRGEFELSGVRQEESRGQCFVVGVGHDHDQPVHPGVEVGDRWVGMATHQRRSVGLDRGGGGDRDRAHEAATSPARSVAKPPWTRLRVRELVVTTDAVEWMTARPEARSRSHSPWSSPTTVAGHHPPTAR